jgi:hypothetical protein
MQPIQFRFSYTEEEYLKAARLLTLGQKAIMARLVVFLALLTGAFVLLLIVVDFQFSLWWALLAGLLFSATLGYLLLFDAPRKYFRGDPKLRDEFVLTFSDEGVQVQTTQIDSKLAWTLYKRVVENKSLYVLVYGDGRMMTVVPKRAFRDADEELQFRGLLRRHVDHSLTALGGNFKEPVLEYVPTKFEPPDWR